jgi:hypothetical protein
MKFSANRLKEPSTWAAIATISMLFGVTDQVAEQLSVAGATLAAVVAIFLPGSGGR